ncbi:MAG: long-chain-fatty-acid--CoA ligase [Betaproteobacteria bacterium]|nr:long-chain-fatty-acid--CoA ligase [Betaproteobacteria bacterium]
MLGKMMNMPLLISSILQHVARHHGQVEVVSRRVEGDIHRYTWADCAIRTRQLASALEGIGIRQGERVGTLAWNGYRHLETYYAVCGMGAITHTINPRLHPDQIVWMIGHAENVAIAFDMTFLPIIQTIWARCPSVKTWIALCEAPQLPRDTGIENLVSYEALLQKGSTEWRWPTFDEQQASGLCYTSGTTGDPKGVLYSHRSTILHAYASCLPDAFGFSARDCILPVVPMFHVNAWGIPYAAPLVGAKLVLPGPNLDGRSLYELFEAEQVTFSGGVPTIWFGLLNHLESHQLRFSTLKRTVIGGSACPPAMINAFREGYGVEVLHAWGMTELSPLGSVCSLQNKHLAEPLEAQRRRLEKQGHAFFGVDLKIVDDAGTELPWDGSSQGNLMARGPWVIQEYFKAAGGDPLQYDAQGEGWFPTGDVATIDSDGYMQITDRSKDVIKSGGEWISSVDLENLAVAHPGVAMAAVIGVPHPKWDERPLLVVVPKPGVVLGRDELLQFFEGKVARWWIPDDVQFVDAIPLGPTGKMLKNRLRERFRDVPLDGH